MAGDRWRTRLARALALSTWGLAAAATAQEPAVAPAAAAAAKEPVALAEVLSKRIEANADGAASQTRVDALSDETDRMATEYRALLQQVDALKIYNRQIEGLIASQNEEMASLEGQIDDVELVSRQVTPLMLQMIASLDEFVRLDVPFLPEERSLRIAGLRELMQRADVTDAERFRRILEAYQIENEYGRTIEAYAGTLSIGGRDRTVEFLRVGRVVLIYQTRDGSEAGMWNQREREWQPLSRDYRSAIRQGLMIARKQAAPDLLRLPVPAPEVVQ